MPEISKQILFIGALYDFALPTSKSRTIWASMKKNFRKAVGTGVTTKTTGTAQTCPLPRNMTTLERRFIQDCVNTFYIRVKTLKSCFVIRNKDLDNPQADILENACKMFIGCFNSYLNSLEGLYVEKYGIVKAHELIIVSVEAFSFILQETVDLDFLPKKIQAVAKNYLSIMSSNSVKTKSDNTDDDNNNIDSVVEKSNTEHSEVQQSTEAQ